MLRSVCVGRGMVGAGWSLVGTEASLPLMCLVSLLMWLLMCLVSLLMWLVPF
jgi:hypothetical protein